MIEAVIRWSLHNRILVLLATALVVCGGVFSLKNMPVDAIPDLSDVQVTIKTSYPGQAPQVVQDQVTYPLTTAMLSVPGAVTVRGYSFFGDSYTYVIFDEDTPYKLIEVLKPDILVKGSDYKGKEVIGEDIVKEVKLIELVKNKSTTKLINKIREMD